jgi:hypothetical protein
MVEMAKVKLKGIHIFDTGQMQFFYHRLVKTNKMNNDNE